MEKPHKALLCYPNKPSQTSLPTPIKTKPTCPPSGPGFQLPASLGGSPYLGPQ